MPCFCGLTRFHLALSLSTSFSRCWFGRLPAHAGVTNEAHLPVYIGLQPWYQHIIDKNCTTACLQRNDFARLPCVLALPFEGNAFLQCQNFLPRISTTVVPSTLNKAC
eukprot:652534-Amphidinium_carterae.1